MDAYLLMQRAGGPQPRSDRPRPALDAAGTARLTCCGDLDLDSSGGVLCDVEDLVALGYRDVHLELDRLRFCDVVGLGALLWTKDRLARADGTLTLSGHSCRSLSLLLQTCGLSAQLEPLQDGVSSHDALR